MRLAETETCRRDVQTRLAERRPAVASAREGQPRVVASQPHPVRRPYVASLAVDRAYRRRGVARCLVGEAERVARSWGHGEVLLEAPS